MCVATKAESLLLRQILRIIQRSEENCFRHLGHWIGAFLEEEFPALATAEPMCRIFHPQLPLHRAMLEVLQEGLLRQEYDPTAVHLASVKTIYISRASNVTPPPKESILST